MPKPTCFDKLERETLDWQPPQGSGEDLLDRLNQFHHIRHSVQLTNLLALMVGRAVVFDTVAKRTEQETCVVDTSPSKSPARGLPLADAALGAAVLVEAVVPVLRVASTTGEKGNCLKA